MNGPEHRDPRARRWTIVLMLLALVVVAGVALRAVDERRRDADQIANRRAQQRPEPGDDAETTAPPDGVSAGEDQTGGDEPAIPTGSPPQSQAGSGSGVGSESGSSTSLDELLGVSISTATSSSGEPVLVVDRLGPVVLNSSASIPYVTSVLGDPDSLGIDPGDANICDATWVAWGLEARFYFGQPPSPAASCEKGPLVSALMTGGRWFIQPLTGGGSVLAVGDPVAAIMPAFPNVSLQRLPPALAALADNDRGYVIVEGSSGADAFPTLYAIGVDGVVASLLYVSGAD